MRIVTFSCSRYAWMRPYHEACFNRAWPNCPYPREWIQDDTQAGWAMTYHRWAARAGTEPTLVLLDDYMVDYVNTEAMRLAFEFCDIGGVGCVRVRACPGPTLPYHIELPVATTFSQIDEYQRVGMMFGEIDKSLPYAVSLQAAVWRPDVLASLILPRWTPWQVEIEGSKHAALTSWKFLATREDGITYNELSVKGVTQPATLAKAKAILEEQHATA